MKQMRNPYHITQAPKAVRHARLDNIALVPASLLSRKGKYQTIANNLPRGGILICESGQKQQLTTILESVAQFFRQRGHFVRTLPYSLI
jgi:hypothetical protein